MTHHGNLKKTGIGPRDFGGEPNIPSIKALFTGGVGIWWGTYFHSYEVRTGVGGVMYVDFIVRPSNLKMTEGL